MRVGDLILGVVVVVLGGAVLVGTRTFPEMPGGMPGPALFPRILAGLLILFGVLLIAQVRRPPEGEALAVSPVAVAKGIGVLAAIAGYIALANRLGFLLTASAMVLAMMLLLGVRVRTAVPVTIAGVLLTALLFERLLRVPLPQGVLGI